MVEPKDRLEKLAKQLVDDLNDRSGINIDFDDDVMAEIYTTMAFTIAVEIPSIIGAELHESAIAAAKQVS